MKSYYKNKPLQLFFGLLIGFAFGFLLQKGGVTKYDVIVGQLRLIDFTVVQIILTAIIVTMLGISILKPMGIIEVKTKSGSIKNSVIGGLIFGVGFGVLGYCPGTIAGAVGNGYIDALTGGIFGMLTGSAIFALLYPTLKAKQWLTKDKYSETTLYDAIKGHPLTLTLPLAIVFSLILYLLH